MSVTITWCAHSTISPGSRQILLNGVDVTAGFTYSIASVSGCVAARSTGTVALQVGNNTLEGYIEDINGLGGDAIATYTRQASAPAYPVVSTDYVDFSRCVADCFESTLAYAMPSCVSRDVSRSVSLLYRSGRAHPFGKAELDAPAAGPAGTRIQLQLKRADGSLVTWTNGATALYYQANADLATHLVAEFDASTLSTGRYSYTGLSPASRRPNRASVPTTVPASAIRTFASIRMHDANSHANGHHPPASVTDVRKALPGDPGGAERRASVAEQDGKCRALRKRARTAVIDGIKACDGAHHEERDNQHESARSDRAGPIGDARL